MDETRFINKETIAYLNKKAGLNIQDQLNEVVKLMDVKAQEAAASNSWVKKSFTEIHELLTEIITQVGSIQNREEDTIEILNQYKADIKLLYVLVFVNLGGLIACLIKLFL
jgi:hypothetical protein